MKRDVRARLIAGTLVLLVTAYLGAYFFVQRTDAYRLAERHVLGTEEANALGKPVAARLDFFGYSMRVSNFSGEASFKVFLRGQNANAVSTVKLKKDLGVWTIEQAKTIPDPH